MSELDDDEDEDDGVTCDDTTDGASTLYLIGYMPWSLIGIHTARVDRDPAYITDATVARAKEIVDMANRFRDSQV
jgi:hypothetical protein